MSNCEWCNLSDEDRKYILFEDEYWTCLLNSFYKDDDPNPHVHLHCRPRYSKPVVIGDNIYSDEEFAHHYALEKSSLLSDEERQIIYSKMKECLSSIL